MKNFIKSGLTLTLAAPADVLSGAMVKVGQIHGVAVADALSGESVVVERVGEYTLTKKAAEALAAGDLAYWNNTAKEITKTKAAGMTLVGVVTVAALAADTTCQVALDGVARVAEA